MSSKALMSSNQTNFLFVSRRWNFQHSIPIAIAILRWIHRMCLAFFNASAQQDESSFFLTIFVTANENEKYFFQRNFLSAALNNFFISFSDNAVLERIKSSICPLKKPAYPLPIRISFSDDLI